MEELISVRKGRDAYQIKICDLGKTVINLKQSIAHSSKEHKKCSSGVQSEAETTQEWNTRLSYQFNIMKEDNSDITGELYNMVANHARSEEDILNINTMAS